MMQRDESTRTAMNVPGRNVSVNTAMVFIAALSCLVSSATCAVALASSMLRRLSRLLSSAILRELVAISMLSLLSLCTMKFVILVDVSSCLRTIIEHITSDLQLLTDS
jgi:hypothetical protein